MAIGIVATPSVVAEALDHSFANVRRTIPSMGTDRPEIGLPDLTYKRCGPSTWVDGFWCGQLWLAFAETRDPVFFEAAHSLRPYFLDRLARPESHDHDLGFLYSLSAVADYKVTGDADARQIGIMAAEALALRFNPAGQFIRAWNAWSHDTPAFSERKRGMIIVDCMENLALLFWAAAESHQSYLGDIAIAHAKTAARYLVRADGSSYHTYVFDPETGEPRGGGTHQGFAAESCWSRGQAWAIHGFAQSYAYSGIGLFRDTACQLANYAIAHLPPDYVPYWDYRLSADAPQYRDSSAAAITAAGLFLLAAALDSGVAAEHYRNVAHAILASLIADYTTVDTPHAEGLLRHGASHVGAGLTDAMLPYGDYFFIEALLRAQGRKQFFW